MKILIAGDWHSELHEETAYQALRQLGHEVFRFSWHEYFQSRGTTGTRFDDLIRRAQNKYIIGPLVNRINRDLVARVRAVRPEVVFVYRGTHVRARTLRDIHRTVPGVRIVGYNNDDPFSPLYPRHLWRHFLESIGEYDLVLAYRQANVEDFRAAGARRVELLRSWYVPERNHPVELTPYERERYACDVVFAGHYEADGRLAILEDVAKQGRSLKLYGPSKYWNPVVERSMVLRRHAPVRQVWGAEYNLAIAGAKIALCFLSRLNRDTYTRRCFEIPATGTMMLAEYTDDLASLFREGKEVAFFRSAVEVREKLSYFLENESARLQIAAAGHRRVVEDGHDVRSRMQQVVGWVSELQEVCAA